MSKQPTKQELTESLVKEIEDIIHLRELVSEIKRLSCELDKLL